MPLTNLILKDHTSLEKILVIINVVLFAASYQCSEVDTEVNTVLIYIMFAIAYFVATSTCLHGAASMKSLFAQQD